MGRLMGNFFPFIFLAQKATALLRGGLKPDPKMVLDISHRVLRALKVMDKDRRHDHENSKE
jgi:hypothetical protein